MGSEPKPTHVVLLYIPARHRNKLCTNAHAAVSYVLLHTSTAAVYVLGERGAWRGVERQKPPYRPPALAWFGVPLLLFLCCFFGPLCPRLSLVQFPRIFGFTAVLLAAVLLSYTHCAFVGCWMFFLLFAVLYYNRFVGCVHGFVEFFFSFVLFFPAYRPRAGIARRTTINSSKYDTRYMLALIVLHELSRVIGLLLQTNVSESQTISPCGCVPALRQSTLGTPAWFSGCEGNRAGW